MTSPSMTSGLTIVPGYLDRHAQSALLDALHEVFRQAPI